MLDIQIIDADFQSGPKCWTSVPTASRTFIKQNLIIHKCGSFNEMKQPNTKTHLQCAFIETGLHFSYSTDIVYTLETVKYKKVNEFNTNMPDCISTTAVK